MDIDVLNKTLADIQIALLSQQAHDDEVESDEQDSHNEEDGFEEEE